MSRPPEDPDIIARYYVVRNAGGRFERNDNRDEADTGSVYIPTTTGTTAAAPSTDNKD